MAKPPKQHHRSSLGESGLRSNSRHWWEVATWEGNARAGQSPYLVAEADESDGSLIKFHSALGIITNIELDHPDHYASIDDVLDIFYTFVKHTKQMLVSLDCEIVRNRLIPHCQDHSFLTYSLYQNSGADYTVSDIVYDGSGTTAIVHEQGQTIVQFKSPSLGITTSAMR